MLSDEEASSREISNLAKDDPSLVSEILKTVNSSYFGLRSKISDFHHAIMFLGFNQVRQLVVANGLHKTMPDTPEFRALHDHCVTVSHLAFALAKHGLRQNAPTVATIGLLHGIGESVILLMKRHSPEWSVLIEALDPAKLGAMLLREWNIPAEVHTVIEYQNHPLYMPPSEIPIDRKEALAVLHIAHLCYDSIQNHGDSRAHHPFVHSYLQLANLPHKSIQDVVENMLLPVFADERQTVAQNVKNFLFGAQKERRASQTTSS
jgi:HD-like signal output (HDOD) protein